MLIKRLWLAAAIAVTIIAILLLAEVTAWGGNNTYYKYLTNATVFPNPPIQTPGDVFTKAGSFILGYWLQFPNAAGYTYGIQAGNWSLPVNWAWILATAPFWLCFGLVSCLTFYHRKAITTKAINMIPALIIASIIGIIVISSRTDSWAVHHILQPFYYLLGALAMMLQFMYLHYRRIFLAILGILIASQFACTIYVISQKIRPEHAWERFDVMRYIEQHNLGPRSVIWHQDWGMFFISGLYGHKNAIELLQAPSIRDVLSEMASSGLDRYIAVLNWRYNNRDIPRYVPGMRLVLNAKKWELWSNADYESEFLTSLINLRHDGIMPLSMYRQAVPFRSYLPFDIPYQFDRTLPWIRPATQRAEYYESIHARIRQLASIECPPGDMYPYKPVRTWSSSPRLPACP